MEIEKFHEINITKEEIFSPSIKESLQNIINNEGYVTHKVYRREISTGGGNYLGALFEVDIKGKTPDEEKEINLFVKKSISQESDEPDTFLSISSVYAKEQFFYDELSKVFAELEDEAKVPEAERLRTIKGYKVSSLDAIIMENLRKQGYKTLDRMEVFSFEFAELSIKQLAKFHGLSLVLKEKKPEYFNSKIKTLKNPMTLNNKFKEVLDNLISITKSNLEEEWINKVANCFSKFPEKYFRSFEPDDSAINCLCHGDYRQNNILIKEVNGKIDDLIPIDYQLIYVGNPLNDFFYFVYLGSDREFRKKHLMELKHLYYKSLTQYLQYFDMDIEDVYPREAFERDFKDKREMGLVDASFIYPALFVIEEEVPSFEDMGKVNFRVDPKLRERILGVLEEYEELGYFKN